EGLVKCLDWRWNLRDGVRVSQYVFPRGMHIEVASDFHNRRQQETLERNGAPWRQAELSGPPQAKPEGSRNVAQEGRLFQFSYRRKRGIEIVHFGMDAETVKMNIEPQAPIVAKQ